MKKVLFLILAAGIFLTSCKKDEVGGVVRLYSGEWAIASSCEEFDEEPGDRNTDLEEGFLLKISNTASNVENEIIIQSYFEGWYGFRGNFKITGDPSGFKGTNESANCYVYSDQDCYVSAASYVAGITTRNGFFQYPSFTAPPAPASANEAGLEKKGIQVYARVFLESGKITPNGATTLGGKDKFGNGIDRKADAISIKIKASHELLVYESYQTPKEIWKDKDKPEFAWRIKKGSRELAVDMDDDGFTHWTFEGYRYTGFDEDEGH